MSKNILRFLVVLFLILPCMFFISVNCEALTDEVTASGDGPTRDEALKAAMRNAVEQAIGVYIKSDTMVKDAVLISDKVLSHSKGYVSKYDVIKEERLKDLVLVTIKATVDDRVLYDDIESLGLLGKSLGNPRIMVAYSTKGETKALSGREFVNEIYNGITEGLTDKQLRVVDRQTSEKLSRQVADTHEIDESLNKAAAFGLKYHAEYTLYYSVSGEIKEGAINYGAKLRIKTQLIDNTRAQIITSKIVEVSSSGQTLEMVLERAARDGGKKVVGLMLEPIQKAWMEMQKSGSLYTVIIDGVDDPSAIASFTAMFEKFPLVNTAREVESGGGKTTFEAEYRGKRDQLDRDVLRAANELGWKMKRIRSEGARSTWKRQS